MTGPIAAQEACQGTAVARGTLRLPPLVIEGVHGLEGSFDRLCLRAGIAAVQAILAGDCDESRKQTSVKDGSRACAVGRALPFVFLPA